MRAALPAWRTAQSPLPPSRAPAVGPHPTHTVQVRPMRSEIQPFGSLLHLKNYFPVKISEVSAPIKKRRHKYISERTAEPSDHLLQPLSPITPPLPGDSPHPLLHTPCGTLLSNGLVFSPMPSLPTSRCNTPLQFEVRTRKSGITHKPKETFPAK